MSFSVPPVSSQKNPFGLERGADFQNQTVSRSAPANELIIIKFDGQNLTITRLELVGIARNIYGQEIGIIKIDIITVTPKKSRPIEPDSEPDILAPAKPELETDPQEVLQPRLPQPWQPPRIQAPSVISPSPDKSTNSRVNQILAALPKDQADAVREVDVRYIDGPLGIQGAVDSRKPGRVIVDRDDQQRLTKTLAHESFHSFALQKLLPAFLDYSRYGTNDIKGYGRNMEKLWNLYLDAVRSQDYSAMPTDYAQACLNDIYRFQSQQKLVVGFMEYSAELASEIEVNGGVSSANHSLDQASLAMREIIAGANA